MRNIILSVSLLIAVTFAHGISDDLSNVATQKAPQNENPENSPAEIIDDAVDGLSDWVSDESADEKLLELMSQGKYVRKSIMVLPALFWIGEGRPRLSKRQVNLIIESLRDSLSNMSRFDINPVPERANRRLFGRWNREFNPRANQEQRIALLGQLIGETLTPDLLGFMSGVMQERAEKNLTEDQMNSFMVDKAKESGVTAAELNLVLNSGYVAVPTMSYVAYGYDRDNNVNATLQGGLILYKVRVSKERAWLEEYATILRVGQKIKEDQYSLAEILTFPSDWKTFSREKITFNLAVRDFAQSVAQDVRDQRDFRLLTQMSWAEGKQYHLPFSAGEIQEVKMDKFFETVEQVEDDRGNIVESVTGWGYVYKGDNFKYPIRKLDENIDEYTWQAYAPKGEPMAGSVAREYSRVPVGVDFCGGVSFTGVEITAGRLMSRGRQVSYKNNADPNASSTINTEATYMGFQTSLSPLFNVSQLSMRININLTLADINREEELYLSLGNGADPIEYMMFYNIGFGLQKKWWLGRWIPRLGLDFVIGDLFLYGNTGPMVDALVMGAKSDLALEFAFSPNIRLGAFVGGNFTTTFRTWDAKLGDRKLESFSPDAIGGNVQLLPLSYHFGINLMVNSWPLRKLWDNIMSSSTSGVSGVVRNLQLRPIYY